MVGGIIQESLGGIIPLQTGGFVGIGKDQFTITITMKISYMPNDFKAHAFIIHDANQHTAYGLFLAS